MMAATATPASRSVATWTAGPRRARRYTTSAVASAATNAAADTPNPPAAAPAPLRITTIAPSAAPDETPMMAGSAMALRNNAWNTAPAAASPAPTTTASITRGNRSWNRITSVV